MRTLQTTTAISCLKEVLMIFNFGFWISGIVILAIGLWMEVNLYKYMEMSTEISHMTPYALIGIGSLIVLVGSFTSCCEMKGQPILLYVYGAFLVVVFVMKLTAGVSIYAYRTQLIESFDKGINQNMLNCHNGTVLIAPDFDNVQETFQCCGNYKFTDWKEWMPEQPIPLSCCKKPNCNTNVESEIYKQGCDEKVIEFLYENIGMVAVAAVEIAFVPLAGCFISCSLGNIIKKAKYEQIAGK